VTASRRCRTARFYEESDRKSLAEMAIVPLASPMNRSPATITAAMTFPAHYQLSVEVVALAMVVAVGCNLLIMLSARPIGTLLQRHNVMERFIRITGMIVATIAVQMVLTGWPPGTANYQSRYRVRIEERTRPSSSPLPILNLPLTFSMLSQGSTSKAFTRPWLALAFACNCGSTSGSAGKEAPWHVGLVWITMMIWTLALGASVCAAEEEQHQGRMQRGMQGRQGEFCKDVKAATTRPCESACMTTKNGFPRVQAAREE